MKEIKLTQGYKAIVDDKDFVELSKHKWHVQKGRKKRTLYAFRTINKDGRTWAVGMHRQILGITARNILVDHIDRNGLNNRRSNLRLANTYQSVANRDSHTDSTSKFFGVSWHKASNKWMAQINKNYKKIYLGVFENDRDAARAYNKAAKKLHGVFANLNILPKINAPLPLHKKNLSPLPRQKQSKKKLFDKASCPLCLFSSGVLANGKGTKCTLCGGTGKTTVAKVKQFNDLINS